MERRTFLRNSSISFGALTFTGWGCASTDNARKAGGSGPVSESYRVGSEHLVFGPDGARYHIDPHDHGLHAVEDGGAARTALASFGQESAEVNFPIDGAVGEDGTVYVVDHGNHRVAIFDRDGRAVGQTGELLRPRGLILGRSGEFYVCDTGAHQVDVFDPDGSQVGSITVPDDVESFSPCALAEDSAGNLHVVDSGGCQVVVFSPGGEVVGSYGGHGDGDGEFFHPRAIAIDSFDNVCVAEATSGFITVFDLEGSVIERFQAVNADGDPVAPLELTIDPQDRLYVWAPEIHGPDPSVAG